MGTIGACGTRVRSNSPRPVPILSHLIEYDFVMGDLKAILKLLMPGKAKHGTAGWIVWPSRNEPSRNPVGLSKGTSRGSSWSVLRIKVSVCVSNY